MANPGLLRLLKSENRVSILFITSLSNNVWVFSELFVRQLIRIIEINMYSSNFIDICVISLLVANTTVLYMKSSGFYALTFRFGTDLKFIKFTLDLALKPLFFIYVVTTRFFYQSVTLSNSISVFLMPSILFSQFRLDKYTNSINDIIIPTSTKYFPCVNSMDEVKNEIIAVPNKSEVSKIKIDIRFNVY